MVTLTSFKPGDVVTDSTGDVGAVKSVLGNVVAVQWVGLFGLRYYNSKGYVLNGTGNEGARIRLVEPRHQDAGVVSPTTQQRTEKPKFVTICEQGFLLADVKGWFVSQPGLIVVRLSDGYNISIRTPDTAAVSARLTELVGALELMPLTSGVIK